MRWDLCLVMKKELGIKLYHSKKFTGLIFSVSHWLALQFPWAWFLLLGQWALTQ